MGPPNENEDVEMTKPILTTLRGADDGRSMDVNALRRLVLMSAQLDEHDKGARKAFKKATKRLESEGRVTVSAGGVVKLSASEAKGKKDGKKRGAGGGDGGAAPKKKRKGDSGAGEGVGGDGDGGAEEGADGDEDSGSEEGADGDGDSGSEEGADGDGDSGSEEGADGDGDSGSEEGADEDGESGSEEGADEDGESGSEEGADEGGSSGAEAETKVGDRDKNKKCKGNPKGITRLFVGNLPFSVDEASLASFLSAAGEMTHVKWVTDRETGQFYGSSFVEMRNSTDAAAAVAMSGKELMGRRIKINFAAAQPGHVWPPQTKNRKGQAGGSGMKAMNEKPKGCDTLFVGNIPFDADKEKLTKFFAVYKAKVKEVRFVNQKRGDSKGCAFVKFLSPKECEKAAQAHGNIFLGRNVRLDWASSK